MARSRRKTPISAWCESRPGTNKWWQRTSHKRNRAHLRMSLITEQWERMPVNKQYGDEWSSPRDGKMWFGNLMNNKIYNWWSDETEHEEYERLMRK